MTTIILVAEDDPGIRLSITDFLEASGYAVTAAANGQEALDSLTRQRPHLLVADIAMPNLDGYELVSRLRQHLDLRLLPVIFLTERTRVQERIRGYQVGCDLYLPKPFDLQELGAAVHHLLERAQMIQTAWEYSYRGFMTPDPSASPWQPTQRELQLLKLLAQGLSNSQIGAELHLSPRTVEKTISHLLRKTETSNRASLVHFVMKYQLLSSPGTD